MVEHVNIMDGDRHEPRGASTAIEGQVLKSAGLGKTKFERIKYSELLEKPTVGGYVTTFQAYSSANQLPTALNTPLQVNFGSPQASTDVSLAANGTITFNTAGNYAVTLFLRFGKDGGGTSTLISRFLVNGVQGLNSNAVTLVGADASLTPFSTTLGLVVVAGTTLQLQVVRDGSGANSGGLYSMSPTTAGWNIVPSATVVVSKFVGISA